MVRDLLVYFQITAEVLTCAPPSFAGLLPSSPFNSVAVFIVFDTFVPDMFVIIAMMIAIIITTSRLEDAAARYHE